MVYLAALLCVHSRTILVPQDDLNVLAAEMRSSLPEVLDVFIASSHDSTQQQRFAFEARTGAFLYVSDFMVALRSRNGKDFLAVSQGGRMPPGELSQARPLGYETDVDTFASLIDGVFPLLAIEDAVARREGFESATRSEEVWVLGYRYVSGSRGVGRNDPNARYNPKLAVTLHVASDGFLLSRQVEGQEIDRYERPNPMPPLRRMVSDYRGWKVTEVKAGKSADWAFDVTEAQKVLDGVLTMASRTVLVDRTTGGEAVKGVKPTAVTVGIEEVPGVEGRAPAWRTPVLITGGLLVIVGVAAALRRRAEGGA